MHYISFFKALGEITAVRVLLIIQVFHLKSEGGKNLDKQIVRYATRRFSNLIERNKEHRAYSDFKEGINKGLDIAKFTFEDHVEKFDLSNLEDNQTIKIQNLQNEFNSLIDTLDVRKKPNCSEEHLVGIYKGFEKSKSLFGEFIKEFI